MSETEGLRLEWARAGRNGQLKVVGRLGNDILAVDELNISKAAARKRFIKGLCEGRAGIDRQAVEAELLRIAADYAAGPAAGQAGDLDVSHIVRPELFHTNEVSGVLIPTATLQDGKPVGHWLQYLRWHEDGKREVQTLDTNIELKDKARVWLWPQPGPPLPTTRPGWSAAGRKAWLAGSTAPNAAEVFRRICEGLARFVDFPPDSGRGDVAMVSLWTLLGYAYPVWAAVPYLNLAGPKESGKTTLLRAVAEVAYRPLQASSLTGPVLFRTLHEQGGVLLLDEAERLREQTPEAGELRAILLSGYARGSPARRLEKVGDTFRQVAYEVYGPKAVAGIAALPEALASRCIRLGMFRASPDSPKPRRRIEHDAGRWRQLRDDLHALALENGPTWMSLAELEAVCPGALGGRDYQLWQPVCAVASFVEKAGAEGLLKLVQEHAVQSAEAGRDDSTPEADELLLRILSEAVTAGTAAGLTPGEVLRLAKEREHSLFDKWSARGVSGALRRYGLRTVKTGGRKVYRDVTVELLELVAKSYSLDLSLGTYPTCPMYPKSALAGPQTGVTEGT